MAFSGLMSKVAFVNKVPMLMKATSADPTPPAGHIYEEIASITFESLEQNDVLVEFLVERLKKTSPYIKLKVLLIMKAVLRKGHKEFRSSLSRQSQGIREAKSFNAPPDPLHGDTPIVNVREAAGELLQMLFDTDWTQDDLKQSNSSSNLATRIQGFGSSNFSGNSQSRSNSSQNLGDQSAQELSTIGYAVQRVKDNFAYAFNQNVLAVAKYQGKEEDSGGGYKQFNDREKSLITRPSQTFNILGSNSNNTSDNSHGLPERLATDSSGTVEQPSFFITPLDSVNDNQPNDDAVDVEPSQCWPQEVALVDKITAQGGIRLNPGNSELGDFVKRCEFLDFEKIIDLLDEKLKSDDYRVQMKSLFVIEKILHSSISNSHEIISSKLGERFRTLSSSNQTAVKNKSTKLLHMIQTEHTQPELQKYSTDQLNVKEQSKTTVKGNQSPNSQLVDLLSDLDVSLSSETKMQNEDFTVALIGDIPSQETEIESLTSNAEVQGLKSVSESRQSKASEVQGSNLSDLLDLDPFSRIENVGTANQLQASSSHIPVSKTLEDAAQRNAASDHVNFDPFFFDGKNTNLSTSEASNDVQASSGFDFLLDDKATEKSLPNGPLLPAPQQSVTPQASNPTPNLQIFPDSRQSPSQFLNKNPVVTGINQSNFNTNFYSTRPTMPTGQGFAVGVVNRPRPPASTNKFDFISSSKKPGAFDFVKDAMEASKKK